MLLTFNWSISKAYGYEGQNVCTMRIEGKKVSGCMGGNYDMPGTCLSLWMQEHFWCMGLTTKNRIIYLELVSLGTLTEGLVHPREVFKSAIIKGVACLIFCHNHPSGEAEPSGADIDITKRLKEGGELLGLKVLDHIIISDDGLYSFQREGKF